MKTLLLPSRVLFVTALAAAASLHAQANATPPALGLPRLNSVTRPNDAAPLGAGRFAVDDLSAAGVAGVSKSKRNNVDYLALAAGKEWSRPLRGNGKDVTFVSFQVYASQTTIVDVAGARLGLTAGPMADGLQLMFDDSATGTLQWRSLEYHVRTGRYDGRKLAALPTLTVRLDPEAGTWDLYVGSRLFASGLPSIAAKRADWRFSVRAGAEGAWVGGLVLADEHPLYEDGNGNGIADAFERQARGAPLPVGAPAAQVRALAAEWREAQRRQRPAALAAARVQADAPPGR